jgi:RNA polymerase sigma factor (sigma-70 family)
MTERHELISTRASLLGRLNDWRAEDGWMEFFDIYWKLIYHIARRSGLSHAEAKDVVHETIIAVRKNLPSFLYLPGTGSFKNWLLRLTHWRIIDRQRQPHPAGPDLNAVHSNLASHLPPAPTEIESLWGREWNRNLIHAAVDRVRLKVDARQFQIFDLCVLRNWPVSRIVKTLKIHRARIYLAKFRITCLINKEARHLDQLTPMTLSTLPGL